MQQIIIIISIALYFTINGFTMGLVYEGYRKDKLNDGTLMWWIIFILLFLFGTVIMLGNMILKNNKEKKPWS